MQTEPANESFRKKFCADVLGLTLEGGDGFMSTKLPDGSELGFIEGEATRGTSPQIVFGLDRGRIDTFEFGDPDAHALAFYQDEGEPRR